MSTNPTTDPQRFASFTLEKQLGGGSYGDVYLAKGPSELTNQTGTCALKILHRAEAEALARLENEAFALQKLNHPSVPKFYHYAPKPSPHIAMELVEGVSIRQRRREQNNQFDPNTVMVLLKRLLEVLVYIHSQGIWHRDIKDDNILMSPTGEHIWLVDFGFCKATGQPRDPQTWGDVGANLCSPPSKLEHPRLAKPNHDVFAVGVLAYLLLSGKYPWYAEGESADRGTLLHLLKETKPTPLIRLVPAIPRNLAKFIEDLINIDDDVRPESPEALDHFRQMESFRLSSDVTKAIYQTVRPQCPRVFRDTLHGDIRLTEFEWSVLSTSAVQRLGYIKQLGTTHYVYRGATHTRLLHSLGTLHVIERIMTSAEEAHGDLIDEDLRLIARLYALVHDVTHISYGHTLEDELALFPRHDKNYERADRIVGVKTEIGKLLRSTTYGRAVLKYFDEAPTDARNQLAEEMLASPAGADVLDYLDRDALFCGLDERVDSSIFRRFRIIRDAPGTDRFAPSVVGKHGLRIDAASAITRIFSNRYSLYEKVYCHPVKICSSAMVGKAVDLACGKSAATGKEPILREDELEEMGDDELLLRLRESKDSAISKLARRILLRSFFKTAFVATLVPEKELQMVQIDERIAELNRVTKVAITTPEGRAEFVRKVAKSVKKGLTEEKLIIYVTSEPPGYTRLKQYKKITESDASLERDYDEIRRRHVRLWKLYVFCAESTFSLMSRISEVVENLTMLKNELPDISRTPRLI